MALTKTETRARAATRQRENVERHKQMLKKDPTLVEHGTLNAYTNWGCHCEKCKTAWAEDFKRRRADREKRLLADPTLAKHGSASTYANWRCRCPECTDAHNAYYRNLRNSREILESEKVK